MAAKGPIREVLTPQMIKAARSLTGIDQVRLAQLAQVSRKTIATIENKVPEKIDARRRAVLERVRRELEALGVEFSFPGDEGGAGVRVRRDQDVAR